MFGRRRRRRDEWGRVHHLQRFLADDHEMSARRFDSPSRIHIHGVDDPLTTRIRHLKPARPDQEQLISNHRSVVDSPSVLSADSREQARLGRSQIHPRSIPRAQYDGRLAAGVDPLWMESTAQMEFFRDAAGLQSRQ
jgi:hypothetical protein